MELGDEMAALPVLPIVLFTIGTQTLAIRDALLGKSIFQQMVEIGRQTRPLQKPPGHEQSQCVVQKRRLLFTKDFSEKIHPFGGIRFTRLDARKIATAEIVPAQFLHDPAFDLRGRHFRLLLCLGQNLPNFIANTGRRLHTGLGRCSRPNPGQITIRATPNLQYRVVIRYNPHWGRLYVEQRDVDSE
ncbi:MAG: hypothetical protein ABJF10_02185 [Chthoniobacter sp.]|uniref:hypothetical protein n=1 Tax=Chthoniobacter sp. TaxID=2510640 RepID=UPI0032A539B8